MTDYTRVKVRGYHLDHYGHLNNASYVRFLEEARWAIFETNNAIEFFADKDFALTAVRNETNYRRPAFLNETLEIHTKLLSIGTSSVRVQQTIYLADTKTMIADSNMTFVLMDKETLRSIPIPDDARHKLEQLANYS